MIGNRWLVGAAGTYPSTGTAYIYTKRAGHKWPQRPGISLLIRRPTTSATTLADPGPGGDTFGESVAVDGPHLVVGAD